MLLYICTFFFISMCSMSQGLKHGNILLSKAWFRSLRKQRQLAFAMFYQPHGSEAKEIGSWEAKYLLGATVAWARLDVWSKILHPEV